MSANISLPLALRDEVAALLAPLVDAAKHPLGAQILLQAIGRTDELGNHPSLRAEIGRLASVVQEIGSLQAEALDSWPGIGQLLNAAANLFAALRSIERMVQDPALGAQARDLGRDLVEQLLALHLRVRHPTLFRATSLLTLIEPAETAAPQPMVLSGNKVERLSWSGDRLQLNRIKDLLNSPLPTLGGHYFPNGLANAADAHASARRLFPLLSLLAQTLGLTSFHDIVPAVTSTAPPAPIPVSIDADHFGDEEPGDSVPVEFPMPESTDLTGYFESTVPRFVVVLPGQVKDGVVNPARFAVAGTVSSARHPGGARGLVISLLGELRWSEVRDGWKLTMQGDGRLPGVVVGPGGVRIAPSSSAPTTGTAAIRIEREAAQAGTPAFVVGATGATRLEIGSLQIGADAQAAASGASIAWHLDARSGAFIITPDDDNDGFLSSILPAGGMRTQFDLGLSWSSDGALALRGSAGLDATVPVGLSVGGLRLSSVHLGLQARETGVSAEVSASIAATIGPVHAMLDRIGLAAHLVFPEAGGNLGAADLKLGLKPPSGVALAVDAKVVKGGGFLFYDDAKKQYAGIVELEVERALTLKAVGLLATRLPGGAKGYSLLVIITAEGFKPIPIGMGFTLTGIGGLLAIHRTFNEAALREGLKNRSLEAILFPRDPIRNAGTILAQMEAVFPARGGSYIFGPMVRIAWGVPTMLLMDLALLLELGHRHRLVVLGRVRAALPRIDNDLVRLTMDALGILDFDEGSVALDAVLVDSRLLNRFPLTGQMALRLRFSSPRGFALAVGGMHRAFAPPANFPTLERIAVSLTTGDNPRLTCEAYFALTSNSVQFGAHAFLYAAAFGFSIQGDIGFDVLIQVNPFHFLAEFAAGVQLKKGSRSLFKVRVEGALEGPRPLTVRAKATFEVLWWDVSIRVNRTLVEGERPAPPPAVSAFEQLKAALADARSWSAELPAAQGRIVSVRERAGEGVIRAHPLGVLAVRQSVVPLNLARDIDKFGDAPVAGARRFAVTSVTLGTNTQTQGIAAVREDFAPAQYFEMSDELKLASPSYEPMDAGVRFGAAEFTLGFAERIESALEYETRVIDRNAPAPTAPTAPPPSAPTRYALSEQRLYVQAWHGAAGRSELRRGVPRAPEEAPGAPYVAIQPSAWSVASADTLRALPLAPTAPGAQSPRSALTFAEAAEFTRGVKQRQLVRQLELVP